MTGRTNNHTSPKLIREDRCSQDRGRALITIRIQRPAISPRLGRRRERVVVSRLYLKRVVMWVSAILVNCYAPGSWIQFYAGHYGALPLYLEPRARLLRPTRKICVLHVMNLDAISTADRRMNQGPAPHTSLPSRSY